MSLAKLFEAEARMLGNLTPKERRILERRLGNELAAARQRSIMRIMRAMARCVPYRAFPCVSANEPPMCSPIRALPWGKRSIDE